MKRIVSICFALMVSLSLLGQTDYFARGMYTANEQEYYRNANLFMESYVAPAPIYYQESPYQEIQPATEYIYIDDNSSSTGYISLLENKLIEANEKISDLENLIYMMKINDKLKTKNFKKILTALMECDSTAYDKLRGK